VITVDQTPSKNGIIRQCMTRHGLADAAVVGGVADQSPELPGRTGYVLACALVAYRVSDDLKNLDSVGTMSDSELEPTQWKIFGDRLVDENPFIRLSIASVGLPDGTEFEQYVMRMR
jgi:hypothetical protein